jgi:RHS repeat-associated protein
MDADQSAKGGETGADATGMQPQRTPSISLPKGGGAIRGIGEKFSVSPATGTASMTVPIFTSPGRSAFEPQLSLAYNSGSGNGPFGFGWRLSAASIARKTDKGLPRYDDARESDVFILSDAEDLVPALGLQGGLWLPVPVPDGTWNGHAFSIKRYRPRVEGLFARIERWQRRSDGDLHWRVVTKDNSTSIYGLDPSCRIADPSDSSRIFKWLLEATYDDKGNLIVYEYKAEDATGADGTAANERNRRNGSAPYCNVYIKRILYGATTPYNPATAQGWPTAWLFEVVFDYGEHSLANPTPAEDPSHPWSTRADPFSTFRSTFDIRTYRLCQRVLMFHHFPAVRDGEAGYDGLVRSTDFSYDQADPTSHVLGNPIATKLLAVTQRGYALDDTGAAYTTKSFPPLEFEYSVAEIDSTVRTAEPGSLDNLPIGADGSGYQWLDLDGEGLSGIVSQQAGALWYKRNISPINTVTDDGTRVTLVRFAPVERISSQPGLSLAGQKPQFMGLAADGHQNMVNLEGPMRGYYRRTDGPYWDSFCPFESFPNLDTRNPNLKFIDVVGDGLTDILVSEDEVMAWYRSLGTGGFASRDYSRKPLDEERGAALVFNDPTQSIFLADMSGDGLVDIVRIRNGEVSYWPNLGYGRFGPKVMMDNSPLFDTPDLFDPRRIRLADIDGSGTSDILYLAARGVAIFHNQSGNSWSGETTLSDFPAISNFTSIVAMDLLGSGTSCLVWSSVLPHDGGRQMRYVDLMGGVKPHLLVGVTNNLGAETRVSYASSTKFYVEDREAGTPWVTKLAFPVFVVEQVEVYDYVGRTRLATNYRYRHGYFDGVEREFRGFGYVEQSDAESFDESGRLFTEETDAEADALNLPPVVTKTWFHTGAWPGEETIIHHMARDYYGAPKPSDPQFEIKWNAFLSTLLPDTVLPLDILLIDGTRVPYALDAEEQREGIRALKGSILRQEIFANDGTGEAGNPYSISARNYTIETLQPKGTNLFGGFSTHSRETIESHLERSPADARVSHSAVLDVNPYGDVLRSIIVAYGRNLAQSGLQSELPTPGTPPDPAVDPSTFAQPEQLSALLTLNENAFTVLIDDASAYRGPMTSEARVYEVTRPARADDSIIYLFADLANLAASAAEIPYEAAPDPAKTQKRLVEDVRTFYFKNDLSGAAPFGQTESLGLVFGTHKLALTETFAEQVFLAGNSNPNKPVSEVALDAVLSGIGSIGSGGFYTNSNGGYVHSQGDSDWWIPSGQTIFSPVPSAPAVPFPQDAAFASANFFLPQASCDPFGQYTRLTYDSYNLLLQETRDALANTVVAQCDYRVLKPKDVLDPNGNLVGVMFDALGMIVGTAVQGKINAGAPESGDSFATFTIELLPTDIEAFIESSNPQTLAPGLLGTATTRIIYDLERFSDTQTANPADPTLWEPVFSATLVREIHVGALAAGQQSKVQVSISYSDGLGREIQNKAQAEPGPLDLTDPAAPTANHRWIGSGWTILNNKGKPVRRYEPFFSATQDFEFANKVGVAATLFYDPLQRIAATLHPDNTWEKVVISPWMQQTWDGNDTVAMDPKVDSDVGDLFSLLPDADYLPTWYQLRTTPASAATAFPDPSVLAYELDAANKAAVHNDTPVTSLFDVLGRPFLSVAQNRAGGSGPVTDQFYSTRTQFDIEGNTLRVTDPLGRVLMAYGYDQAKNKIHSNSMDAGERWMLLNVAGKPIELWDSRQFARIVGYDELLRPIRLNVSGNGLNNVLVEQNVYGETKPGGPATPEATNSRGKIYQAYDGAGVIKNFGTNPLTNLAEGYDFKGNLLRSQRQLLQDYKDQVDWSQSPALQNETFMGSNIYDALNRLTQQIAPHSSSAGSGLNIVQHGYNEGNLLDTLDTWLQQAVEPASLLNPSSATIHTITGIIYDEKGQRIQLSFGNGASTTFTYDSETFRLTNLLTTRGPGGPSLQDMMYFYDPVGNITHLRDNADIQDVVYFRNRRVEPSADFVYDAIYRLISATGREHLGLVGSVPNAPTPQSYNDWTNVNLPHPNDGNAMGTYVENFGYDAAGNISRLQHIGSTPANPGWTRSYLYAEASMIEPVSSGNRLTKTSIGASADVYSAAGNGYDSHGNMLTMPQLQVMKWNFKDQLQMTQRQAVNSEDADGIVHKGERTYYAYSADGQRVLKTTEASTGILAKQRIYLGGFEIYREFGIGPPVNLERQTLHVMNGKQRVALVEIRTQGNDGTPALLNRYQLGNHLDSTCLELDDQAQVISYEEYYPYGGTSYQGIAQTVSSAAKRFRYTGKEQDEESGLYYYGARYYAPWLARWTECDPKGIDGGHNLYAYSNDSPVVLNDPSGHEPVVAKNDPKPETAESEPEPLEKKKEPEPSPPQPTVYYPGPTQTAGLSSDTPILKLLTEFNSFLTYSRTQQKPVGPLFTGLEQFNVRARTSTNVEQGVLFSVGGTAPFAGKDVALANPGSSFYSGSLQYTLHQGGVVDSKTDSLQVAHGNWLNAGLLFGNPGAGDVNPTATYTRALSLVWNSCKTTVDFNAGATLQLKGTVNNQNVKGLLSPVAGLNVAKGWGPVTLNLEGVVGANVGVLGATDASKGNPKVAASLRYAAGLGIQAQVGAKMDYTIGAEILISGEEKSNVPSAAGVRTPRSYGVALTVAAF